MIGEQPRPMGTLALETSMPRLLKRLAKAESPAVVVLVQHAFAVVEPEDPQGAGVATARIARDAATKTAGGFRGWRAEAEERRKKL